MALVSSSQLDYHLAVESLRGGNDIDTQRHSPGFHHNVPEVERGAIPAYPGPGSDQYHGHSSGSVLGGSGNTISIDSRIIYPHFQPSSDSSGPSTSTVTRFDRPDESATETYTRILFSKRIGYPLWIPEPHNFPPEYEAEGIRIGDVGIVNEEGLFEFSFNVCLVADHPINAPFRSRLPPSFVPFTYTPNEVLQRDGAFAADTVIVGRSVRERLIYPQTQHGGPRGPCEFDFDCSAPDGAVLVLPNGAGRTDFSSNFRPLLLAHARKHALSWLEWVYGSLEYATSLYLITGCDKCDNWCLAAYSNVAAEIGVSLSFVPITYPDGVPRYAARSSGAITRRTCMPQEQNHRNQCVFIRGYKISACRTFHERLRVGAIKISDAVSQTTEISTAGIFERVPGASFLSWFLLQFAHLEGSGKRTTSEQEVIDSHHAIKLESFPGSPEVHHPLDIINLYLLSANPSAQFAITHDDDWCSVIEESDEAFPNDLQLLQRVLGKYSQVHDGGCVTLVENEELTTINLDSTRQDHQSISSHSSAWSFLQIPQQIKEPENPAPVSEPSLSAIFDEQGQRQKQQTVAPYPSEQTDIQSAPKSPISGSGPQPLSADDIVIVVVGPTGVGKSSFIKKALGQDVAIVGYDLSAGIRSYRYCPSDGSESNVILVDTPGFDDTEIHDADILAGIAQWLKKSYDKGITFSGLLYLHCISGKEMSGAPLKNFTWFEDLCGRDIFRNIILVTTMWDKVDAQEGLMRQNELELKYSGSMIKDRYRIFPFYNTEESAWDIIGQLGGSEQPSSVQKKMANQTMSWIEDSAARIASVLMSLKGMEDRRVRRTDPSVLEKSTAFRRFQMANEPMAKLTRCTQSGDPESAMPSTSASRRRSTLHDRSHVKSRPSATSLLVYSNQSEDDEQTYDTILRAAITLLSLVANSEDMAPVPGLKDLMSIALKVAESTAELRETPTVLVLAVYTAGRLALALSEHARTGIVPDVTQFAIDELTCELQCIERVVNAAYSRDLLPGRSFVIQPLEQKLVADCNARIQTVTVNFEAKSKLDVRQVLAGMQERICRPEPSAVKSSLWTLSTHPVAPERSS